MLNSRLADYLNQLLNASRAKKSLVRVVSSSLIFEVSKLLKQTGYLKDVEVDTASITATLNEAQPISHLSLLSKPSLRRYVRTSNIPRTKSGYGVVIVSTPKGVMTSFQARKQKTGGELICEVW